MSNMFYATSYMLMTFYHVVAYYSTALELCIDANSPLTFLKSKQVTYEICLDPMRKCFYEGGGGLTRVPFLWLSGRAVQKVVGSIPRDHTY